MPDDCKFWNVLDGAGESECGDDDASRFNVLDEVDEADEGDGVPVADDGDVIVAFVGVTMFSTDSELFDLLELTLVVFE